MNNPKYVEIFKDYQKTLEKYISTEISKSFKFNFDEFVKLVNTHKEEIDETILEFLNSFSDLKLFLEIMVEQRSRVLEEIRTVKKLKNKANSKT